MRSLTSRLGAGLTVAVALGAWPVAAFAAPARTVELARDFHNPLLVTVPEPPDQTTQELGCAGSFVARPLLVEVKEALEDVTISGGEDQLVQVKRSGKRYCAAHLHFDALAAGPLEVFLGRVPPAKRRGRDAAAPPPTPSALTLRIEDLQRPLDLGWSGLPRLRLDQAPATLARLEVARAEGAVDCQLELGEGRRPDALIEITRTIPDLQIVVRAAGPLPYVQFAQVSADLREIRELRGWHPTLEPTGPGLFAVSVSQCSARARAPFVLLALTPATHRNPLTPPGALPDNLPLEQRDVLLHFPELLDRDLRDLRVRLALFQAAPRQLFVFPKAQLHFSFGFGSPAEPPGARGMRTMEVPGKDEPLLIAGDEVLTVDGDEYGGWSNLASTPSGAVSLPDHVRNARWPDPKTVAKTARQTRALASLAKEQARFEQCEAAAWKQRDVSGARRPREPEAKAGARDSCKLAAFKRHWLAVYQDLARPDLALRERAVRDARARLPALLTGQIAPP
jgi:hypothetical protein